MIHYENYSLSSSEAYFSNEMDLHLFNHVVSPMVLERYRASAISMDEDPWASESDSDLVGEEDSTSASDSEFDEDCFTDTEEQDQAMDSAIMENSHCDLVFGSFSYSSDSDLEMIHTAPIIPFEPALNGFTIKIGEITCFLIANGGSLVTDAALCDLEVKVEDKLQKVKEETLNYTVLSEIAFSATEHQHNGINTAIANHAISIVNYLDLVSMCLDSINRSSATIAVAVVEVLEPHTMTYVDTVESCFVLSDLQGASIAVFDPSRTIVQIYYSAVALSFLSSSISISFPSRVGVFVFDPSGNRRQPPWILLQRSTSTFPPAVVDLVVLRWPLHVRSLSQKFQKLSLTVFHVRRLLTSCVVLQLHGPVVCFGPSRHHAMDFRALDQLDITLLCLSLGHFILQKDPS